MSKTSLRVGALAVLALVPMVVSAGVIGFLGNFDVVDDTGSTAHGFEIELEGLHLGDITDTFSGAHRGFPSGRGFDPATSVQRYGAPEVLEYNNGATFGVTVTYRGLFNGTAWDYGTPSGSFITPGDNCWSGGGVGCGPATPCDDFGVGTTGNATKTTYSWLLETTPSSGALTRGGVLLPAPVWAVVPAAPPAAGDPVAPPVVGALIRAPAPEVEAQFGEGTWVKVFTTELPEAVKLEDLVHGNAKVDHAKTEVEWQLPQVDPGNPASGQLESGYLAPVGAGADSILRRYEFYKFTGTYKPEDHKATFADGFGDSLPGPGDVGIYLGAQNGAVNLNLVAVPEPHTWALMLVGLGAGRGAARRRRTMG